MAVLNLHRNFERNFTVSAPNILVVEDENLVAIDLRSRLEEMGFRVCAVAASGEEAVLAARKSPPDAVLMDIKLRGRLDGIETAQQICDFSDVPVIFLTAYSGEPLLRRAKLTKPHAYLIKPFANRELKMAIDLALARHASEKERKETCHNLEHQVAGHTAGLLKTNEELQRARREWEDIFQAIGHPAMVLDGEHRIIEANRATQRALGRDLAELRGRKCYEFFHPGKDHHPVECPLEKLRESGVCETVEMEVEALGGVFLVSCTPMLSAQGRLEKVIHIVTDITELRQAEQALREREESYRLLVSQIPALVFKGYADWSIDFFDDKIEALTGYSREEFDSGRRVWSSLILPEDYPKVKAKFHEALKTTGTYQREYRIRKKSGEVIWVHVRGQIFLNPAGKIDYISGVIFDITDRKRAEEALVASEANYRTIFNAVNDGIFIHDAATGAILDVNQNALDFTKLTLGEIRILAIEEITRSEPPYTQEEAMTRIRKAGAGEPQVFRWRGRHRSGREYWWELNLKRVKLGDQECVLAVARNITGRLLAQEALKESEKRYHSMFEDSPLSLWQEDYSGVKAYLDGLRSQGVQDIRAFFAANPGAVAQCADLISVIDVNKATLKIFEAGSKEELFQGLCYVLTDESYEVFEEIVMALAEGRNLFEGEGRIQTVKGKKLHVIIRLSVVPGFEGNLSRVLVSIVDITERKVAEESLRKYEFITSASKEYMTLINRNYVYEAANAAYCAAHGKTQEEVVGRTVAAIWGQPVFDGAIKGYLDQCFSGRPVEFEGWFKFACKEKGYYNVSYRPFFEVDGTVAYAAVVTHDITARIRAEEEKRQLESQLLQAQKMEAIGTLAGGIAHDFNNILASLIGYTELALDDVHPGTEVKANLDQVLAAGRRAKGLVQQILTFSRQERQEIQPVQVSLIVKEVLKFLRASLPATISIRQDITAPAGKILADPTQVHQVLLNLCTNASQAMEESGGFLEVRLEQALLQAGSQDLGPDLVPGPYLRLTVSDTGAGMAPGTVDCVFEPFFTTKPRGKGTGLVEIRCGDEQSTWILAMGSAEKAAIESALKQARPKPE